jgi:hypothetical protein
MNHPETNFTTSKDNLSDGEISIYLHDMAREFNSNKMRIVADRFSQLAAFFKQEQMRYIDDLK